MKSFVRHVLAQVMRVQSSYFSYKRERRLRGQGIRRILVVDTRIPEPKFGAGHPRARMIYDELCSMELEVDFYTTRSSRLEVLRFEKSLGRSGFIFGSAQRLCSYVKINSYKYIAVIISRPTNMRILVAGLKEGDHCDCPIIYDAEAVWALRGSNQDELSEELSLASHADLTLAVSQQEADFFKKETCKVVVLSQFSFAEKQYPIFSERRDLLFVGRMTGTPIESPNIASVIWFIDRVMPLLDEELGPVYKLNLAGIIASDEIRERLSDRVCHVGAPSDLSKLYAKSRIFIVPTLSAAGVPTKLIDACAAGLPCVATPLTIWQAGFEAGRDALSGETPETFARSCARLYVSEGQWKTVRESALLAVEKGFSRDAFRKGMTDALTQLPKSAI